MSKITGRIYLSIHLTRLNVMMIVQASIATRTNNSDCACLRQGTRSCSRRKSDH